MNENKTTNLSERFPYLWHYTTGECYESIIKDGFLKPSEPPVAFLHRPILWFSRNQYWEKAAARSLLTDSGELIFLSKAETAQLTGGLFRFGVFSEIAPLSWWDIKQTSGITAFAARVLYRQGIALGAKPGDWRGTYEAVPAEQWRKVEIFEKSRWVPVEPSASFAIQTPEAYQTEGLRHYD
jgi:hypothetical protein